MDPVQFWALVATAVASFLVSFLTKASLAAWVKVVIVAVVAILIAVVAQLIAGKFAMTWEFILALLGFAWAWFWVVIKGLKLEGWLDSHGIHD